MLLEAILNKTYENQDRIAISFGKEKLTYEELIIKSSTLSYTLSKYFNEESIEYDKICCGLVLNQDISGIVAIVSCVLSKIPYVPLDNAYPTDRLVFMSEDSEVSLIITDRINLSIANEINEKSCKSIKIIIIEDIIYDLNNNNFKSLTNEKNPIVYKLYTSGSTGVPKAVVQKSKSIYYYCSNYIKKIGITEDDNITVFSTFGHDAAIIDIFSALISGSCMYPRDLRVISNVFGLHDWLKENRISIWHSVPSFFRKFWGSYRREVKLNSLRRIVLGGEVLRESDYNLYKEKLSFALLYNLYGQTESSYSSGTFVKEKENIKSIGLPIKDTHFLVAYKENLLKCIDSDGNIIIEQLDEFKKYNLQEGELLINSNYIVNGYLNNSKATENTFFESKNLGSVYRTGDFVEISETGDIFYSHRMDNQVKIRGYRVEIGEIESEILKINDIIDCIVTTTIVNEQSNLIAFIKATRDISVVEVNEYIKNVLPSHMLLFDVKIVDEFATTVTGKVDRNYINNIS